VSVEVSGTTEPGFEEIRTLFEQIAREPGESGSAFAATVDGRPVLDLYAGFADAAHSRLRTPRTLGPMFSGTKGVVAIALLQLIERGELDLERPVRDYWPEFATGGKETTLVRHLVAHQAGVPGLRGALEPDDLLDDAAMAARVAAEPAILAPGSAVVYHPFTFGWMCGEIIRRIDGRSAGRYIAEEIATPLGLRMWVGLPEAEEDDVVELVFDPPGAVAALGPRATDTLAASILNPSLPQQWWNSRGFRAAEIPGANGITDALSMARLYGALVAERPERRLLGDAALALGTTRQSAGIDALMGAYSVFGVGFQLDNGTDYFGGVADAFGHGGVGGGRHGGWRSSRVGFSYLPGYVRDGARDDRAPRLLSALARAVGA
jgi:CubicO group peptidase (beta-lactamase class C family)